MSTYVMVGAGNVAWHLGQALKSAGYVPRGVYSRSLAKAEQLAGVLQCAATDSLAAVDTCADYCFIAVKDDAIADVVRTLAARNAHALYIHTAGSVSIDVFRGVAERCGVLYPLQSFTKGRALDFARIPLFVEGGTSCETATIRQVAESISHVAVTELCSEKRRLMHLAAVFASNFANACYACAAEVMAEADIPFERLLPLIDETCAKVHELHPADAQTGPAVRGDRKVLGRQEELLDGTKLDVYRTMSRRIHEQALERESRKTQK